MSEQIEPKVALNRYAEKLAMFRQTLTPEERVMLDAMVSSAVVDVAANSLAVGHIPEGRSAEKIPFETAVINYAQDEEADVQAHALTPNERITLRFDPEVGYRLESLGAIPPAGKIDPGV